MNLEDRLALGTVVRRERLRRGMSQLDLAAALDTSPQWISQVERGVRRASIPALERLAGELGMDVVVVLRRKGGGA